MGWFLPLLIGAALMVVSFMLMPKPPSGSMGQQEVKAGDNPKAEAGSPVNVVFGTKWVKSPNCLWYGDKYYQTSTVSA